MLLTGRGRALRASSQVMMPAYRCNSWSGWFFVVFLVIGLYFLVNLTIAVTYTTFQELSKSKILKKHNRLLKGLSLAYAELTKNAQVRAGVRLCTGDDSCRGSGRTHV